MKRIALLLLAMLMLLQASPVQFLANAAETGTVKGDAVTVTVGNDEITGRDNNFNKGWKFYLGDNGSAQNQNFDDSSWDNVNLPHDFSITQHFTASGEAESGFLPGGTGWYRKTFVMPEDAAGKTVVLNFDGAYKDTSVYVNGTLVGEHHYGYTGFAMDITKYLVCDGSSENVISVKVVNQLPSSRWYSGSGIYRDVTMVVTDPVHVDLDGTYITTPDIKNGTGTVKVENTIVNDGTASASVSVKTTVYKGASEVVSGTATGTVAAGSSAVITTSQTVAYPALWSTEAPNLYKVVTEVSVDGKVVDATTETFGFRWFTFNSQGFQLNGKNVKLDGVCLHHDQGAAGAAAYYDAMYRQISIMKEMGCNAIRTSHNPVDEQFIEICNELGMLVIEEVFDGLVDPKNSNSNDFSKHFEKPVDTKLVGAEAGMTCAEYATRSVVKRDRNEPCIFAWSFGNEIQEGTYWNNVSRYDDICANFIRWANDEDGSRIVTSGDNNRGGDQDLVNVLNTILNNGGVVGFNYANSTGTLSSLANSFGGRNGSIIASETASHTNSRGQYRNQNNNSNSDGKYHLTSYDTSAVGWGITAHDSIYNTYQLDNVAGEFVWTGFDYIGEPTPWNGTGTGDSGRGAIPNSSYFGIVETTGFPKDSYYLYRSQWHDSATTLHLVTAWDADNQMLSGGKTPVWVYSNAPVVKLYLNGDHIGTATRKVNTTAAGHVYYTYTTQAIDSNLCATSSGYGADALYSIFNVTYTAGTISAKAFEANGTTEIALDANCGTTSVSTPGAASKLVVSQNKTTAEADGSSLVYVTVDVTDANGNPDTTATNNISFTVSGPGEIVGVDNGDQATVRKYQNSYVKTGDTTANINAYAGKALVIVRTTEDPGTITVNAAASGLTGGKATINATGEAGTGNKIVSLTMIKDYSVMAGTEPTLDNTAAAVLESGSTVNGTVTWETVAADVYKTAGDYVIKGTASFAGHADVAVTARLHVIPKVIAMRNISAATFANTEPVLPGSVKGVLADGNLSGEFSVAWDAIDTSKLSKVGDMLVVNGVATVLGDETLPVTCTVRVAEGVQQESANVAPMASRLTEDIGGGQTSDNLASVNNGTLKPGDNTNERWTNWNNRTRSAEASLILFWDTAQMLSGIEIYYYYDNCCAEPEKVAISYSLDGINYDRTVQIKSAEEVETYNLGAHFSYTFAEPINPVGLKVTLTQQDGTSGNHCVGVTELEAMTYAAALEPNTSADLSGITVNGNAVADFAANKTEYEAEGDAVAATTAVNAGITVLPEYGGIVRILTVSEDGSKAMTYAVQVGEITEPEETKPQETDPKETEPKETEPKETEPKETEPKETEPQETKPVAVDFEATKANWTGEADSETIFDAKEGNFEYAWDRNTNTIWHTNWKSANGPIGVLTGENVFNAEINFGEAYTINQFSFLPRQDDTSWDDGSGVILQASLFVKASEDAEWVCVADQVVFPHNQKLKTFRFIEQEVQFVKLVCERASQMDEIVNGQSQGYVAVSEFYIDDERPKDDCEINVYEEGNGFVRNGYSEMFTGYGASVTLEAKPDEGNSFVGWFNSLGTKVSEDAEYTFPAATHIVLTAKFQENSYTVTFKNGDETVTRTVNHGDTVSGLPVPTRDGFTFEGWFDAEGNEFTAETVVTGDITVTAKWTEVVVDPTTPEETKPEVTEPEETKPEVTEPEETKPQVTEPEETKPTEPKPTEPKPTEPKPTEPKPTEPKPTEPKPTEPKPTEPKPTEPKPTEPKPTEPAVTEPEETKPTVPECDKDDDCVLSQFGDVIVGDWYHDGIHFCVDQGIMNGMGEGKFAPNEATTRAQLVTMLYRLAGEPSVEGLEEPFTDVTSDDWFYAPIVWAYENKVVNGVTATEFAPNANVTREQVATILHRYLGAPAGTGKLVDFIDASSVSGYAVDALTWAVDEKLITGVAQPDGTTLLDPAGNATRAQIATILMRYLTAE